MALSASKLRQDIYRILDEVLASGVPVEIERKGRRLRIVPADRPARLARLPRRDEYLRGDPDEIVEIDWSSAWRP
ncbi:MAG: type II toxin-antitoxin system Phd/YefM family antitoxin [Planctomycetota bacterium]